MINRLVTFGCSYTYGHGLKDCYDLQRKVAGPNPSSYAWPNKLASYFNLDCKNMAMPGASNKKIWHKVINQDLKLTDIVLILWTHIDRHCIITSKDTYSNIGPWTDSKVNDCFYKYFNHKYDLNIDLNLRMSHISLYLNNKGIKNYHLFATKDNFSIEKYNNCAILNSNFQNYHIDKAEDNKHPGIESHNIFANKVAEEMMERDNEIKIQ